MYINVYLYNSICVFIKILNPKYDIYESIERHCTLHLMFVKKYGKSYIDIVKIPPVLGFIKIILTTYKFNTHQKKNISYNINCVCMKI